MAAGVRATAIQRVQAFHKAWKEGAVASQVTSRGNSERASGKQDLSQNITLAGVMGQIASGDQERTLKIEGWHQMWHGEDVSTEQVGLVRCARPTGTWPTNMSQSAVKITGCRW